MRNKIFLPTKEKYVKIIIEHGYGYDSELETTYYEDEAYIFTNYNSLKYAKELLEMNSIEYSIIECDDDKTDSMSYLNIIIGEIECEINKYPEKPNLGKRGCLRRLYELKNIMNKEKDNGL